jgi:RHS repeat-associated protein
MPRNRHARTVIAWLTCLVVTASLVAAIGRRAALAAPSILPLGTSDLIATDLGQPVESRWTDSSRTYTTDDGNYATYVYPGPVNYRGVEGSWKPIDTTLVPSSEPGIAYETKSAPFRFLIPNDLAAAPVEVEVGSDALSLQLESATGSPAVDGNSATFADSIGSADVQYVAGPSGVKENLILADPSSVPSSLTWDASLTNGLSVSKSGGVLNVFKPSGKIFASLTKPYMIDAAGEEAPLGYILSTGAGRATFTLNLDTAWLNDPMRVYPVILDPTINLQPSLDCRILNGTWADTNYCPDGSVKVGTPGNLIHRSLMKFDVSSVPPRANVLSTDLAVYVTDTTTNNAAQVEVHRVTNDWTSGATWNKRNGTTRWTTAGGDFANVAADSLVISSGTGYRHWRPTDPVQKWVDGGELNQGLILKQASESVVNVVSFASVDYAQVDQRPYLLIEYSERVGELKNYTYEERALNDRMSLKVDVADGNLLLKAQDLQMKGTKLDLDLTRYYNSLSTNDTYLGPSWVMNTGTDIRINNVAGPDVAFYGPSGYRVVFTGDGQDNYTSPQAIDANLTHKQNGDWLVKWFSEEKWNFDPSGTLQSMVDKNDNTISFAYNPDGSLATITDTQGRTISFAYTGANKIDYITDTAGNRIFDYSYSGGFLTGYVDPVNGPNKPTAYTYSGGLLTKITDPRGKDVLLGYDTQRRIKTVTRVTDPSTQTGPTFTVSYFPGDTCSGTTDVKGKTVFTDENGHATTYCYDRHDRVKKVIDASGNTTTKTYTSHGNVNQLTEAGVTASLTYDYDANDNLAQINLPGGGTSQLGYDTTFQHFPTSVRDFANDKTGPDATWAYTYGQTSGTGTYGNLKTAKNTALGITFTYAYNADGTVDTITDGRGNITDLNYQGGNLTQLDPAGTHGTLTFTSDCVSRVRTITDQNGNRQTYTYDALDRVELIEYEVNPTSPPADCSTPASTSPISRVAYGYDEDGNLASRFDDVTGTTNFTYDELNRTTKETPQAPFAETDYTYWPNGNLKTVTDDTGTVSYSYFPENTLQQITDQQGKLTTFTNNGRYLRTKTTYPNNVIMEASWDDARRLTYIRSYKSGATCTDTKRTGCITYFSYTYVAPNGNKTLTRYSVKDKAGAVTNYRYDAVGRLTKACPTIPCGTGPANFQYAYDDNGNLSSKTIGSITTSYSYNAANEVTSGGGITYGYDNDGNLTSSSQGLAASYSEKNQTMSVTAPGGSALGMSYQDATQDRRVTLGDQRLAYNQLGLNGQGPNNGNPHATYWVRDNDGVLVSEHDAATNKDYYYVFDALHSVAAVTDPTGAASATYKYEPYGKQTVTGTVFNPWGFASGYHDPGTGLVKFGMRYYTPDLGRWTQRDPVFGQLANPTSLNPYAYSLCDSVNRSDPTGTSVDCFLVNLVSGLTSGASIVGFFVGLVTSIALTVVSGVFALIAIIAYIQSGCASGEA